MARGLPWQRVTVGRLELAEKLAGRFGVEIKETYWIPGPYDLVSIFEASEGKSRSAFCFALESQGNLRLTYADAYGHEEMREVIATGGWVRHGS